MSGPKISEAELARIRQEEEERRTLFQALVRLRDELQRRKEEVMLSQAMLVPIFDKDDVKQHLHKLEQIEKQIPFSLSVIESAMKTGTKQEMQKALDALADKHTQDKTIIIEADQCGSQIRDEILKQHLEKMQISVISEELITMEIQRLFTLLSVLEHRAEKVRIAKSDVREIRKELESVVEDTGRDNLSLFEEIHRIDVYKIRKLRSHIERIEAANDTLDQKLSAELSKYHVICAEMGIEPKKFAFHQDSIAKIQYEIAELVTSRKEKCVDIRAIMKSVRESLSDFGYTYIGEKEENIQIIREAYRIHDNVVLQVTYDSSGRVTMEVAMEDQRDRSPHQREIDQLVKEQESFCQDYEEIFRRINANGLALKNKSLFPCSPEFAQIVNTAGFVCQEREYEQTYYDYYQNRDQKYLEVHDL